MSRQIEIELVKIARSTYALITEEKDAQWQQCIKTFTLALNSLLADYENERSSIDPDLCLNILLFAELKAEGDAEAETYKKEVDATLSRLEKKYGLQQT